MDISVGDTVVGERAVLITKKIPGGCDGARGQRVRRVTLVDPEDTSDGAGLRVKKKAQGVGQSP